MLVAYDGVASIHNMEPAVMSASAGAYCKAYRRVVFVSMITNEA